MRFLEFDEMSRFERARIISARALQIDMGAPPLVKKKDRSDPIEIAKKEFDEGVVPLTVRHREPPKMK